MKTYTQEKRKGNKIAWLLATVCLLLGASCRAPEIGRYQLAIAESANEARTLYIMDTATGNLFQRLRGEREMEWCPVFPLSSTSAFESAITESARRTKAAEERQAKIDAERSAFIAKFREWTLAEQVKAAESILVLQYPPSEQRTVILASRGGIATPTKVIEVLKGSEYPEVGYTHVSASSALRSFYRKNMDDGEPIIYFAVSDGQLEPHSEFLFAREQFGLPEQVDSFTVLPLTRDPAEFIKDIKAILANKEEP